MRVHSLKTNVSEEKFPLLAGALNSGRDITVCPQAFPELSNTETENVNRPLMLLRVKTESYRSIQQSSETRAVHPRFL